MLVVEQEVFALRRRAAADTFARSDRLLLHSLKASLVLRMLATLQCFESSFYFCFWNGNKAI